MHAGAIDLRISDVVMPTKPLSNARYAPLGEEFQGQVGGLPTESAYESEKAVLLEQAVPKGRRAVATIAAATEDVATTRASNHWLRS